MMSPVLLGGVGEIRTLASLTTPNDLANRPLQPLEYHSIFTSRFLCDRCYINRWIHACQDKNKDCHTKPQDSVGSPLSFIILCFDVEIASDMLWRTRADRIGGLGLLHALTRCLGAILLCFTKGLLEAARAQHRRIHILRCLLRGA